MIAFVYGVIVFVRDTWQWSVWGVGDSKGSVDMA